MKEKLVVIGNGMAGMRTVEELIQLAPDKYAITVFGAEPHGNYNRIMLSPVLAGEMTVKDIMINDYEWYEKNRISLHAGPGKEVVNVDREKRRVITQDGTSEPYDRLIIATGSKPFVLPVPGNQLDGVITFRAISDVESMLKAAKQKKKAVVIGGGLLGLEAANGLCKQGMEVTVVHSNALLLNKQLDEPAAKLLQVTLEKTGIQFKMNARTEEIIGNEHDEVKEIRFTNGESLPTDLIVMAVGIRPNIALAQKIGLHCERGIVVNDTMQTYDPKIYAIGECIQHRGDLFGLVAPLWEQSKVAAFQLAETGIGIYETPTLSTKLKVTGINLFSAGDFIGNDDTECLVFADPRKGFYKKIVIKNEKIIGVVLYGDTQDGAWYFNLMNSKTEITKIRDQLIFGQAFIQEADINALSNSANCDAKEGPMDQAPMDKTST